LKLTIDSDKTGYVLLPNGKVLITSAGVINTTYNGYGGNITYYVPKDSTSVVVQGSSLAGSVISNRTERLDLPNNDLLLSVEVATCVNIQVDSSDNLTTLIAPEAVTVVANNCALTAKSIGDILYAAYDDNRASVAFDFSGGNNALQGDVDTYLQATYPGLTYATVYTILVTGNGGTITIDAV